MNLSQKGFRVIFPVLILLLGFSATAQSFITNGLVAYYPLDGNAKDASGNGYDATNNNVSWETNRAGIASAAGFFNGASSYILLPASLVNLMSGTNPMTISAWVETSPAAASGGNKTIVDIGEATQNNMFGILSQLGVFVYSGFGGTYDVDSGVSIADNSWHQCVASFDGTNLSLYVDGVFAIASPIVSNRVNTRGTIGIRADLADEFWNGGIDDVRIYNRSLSSNEVAELYADETFCSPHAAEATAQVVNKFVVGASITDSGCGYTNAPAVLIVNGGGSGATATATVENGVVTSINIINTGSGYTNPPDILIASPPFVPTLSIAVSRVNVMLHVVLGFNYVLESSPDMVNWTATGPQFTAQSEEITIEFVVNQTGQFFRIRQVP
jgi:Concanavalin A-like lectin/glucanases superfamily